MTTESLLEEASSGTPDPVTALVVDDHPMWREAVRADLEKAGVARVVAEASDGREAVDLARRYQPQLVLMDLNLPALGGVEATQQIVEHSPNVRVLVLSASGEDEDVLEAVKAGAAGYVLKSASSMEVIDAIHRVTRGEPVFTPSLAGLVLDELRRLATGRPSQYLLPSRESDVLKLVARGYSYGEIADRLSISGRTVGHYMQNVLTRLQLRHEDALLDGEDQEARRSDAEEPSPERVLTTLLFTDIVQSTERAAGLGDHRWRDVLESHHAIVRRELTRFRGREVDTAGDGFLASFDQPANAISCARAVVGSVRQLGIEIRASVHTGECERIGDSLRGIAVHIGARIAATAEPSEILVSSTVKDLVAGSGIEFSDRGTRALKGIPGQWHVFAVSKDRPK